MIQFSLEEYLRNPRDLVTRNGRKARVICKDRVSKVCPLVVLVTMEDGEEIPFTYHTDGKFYHDESELDLFFAPEKHEGWMNVYRNKETGIMSFGQVLHTSRKEAEELAKPSDYYVATAKIEWEE